MESKGRVGQRFKGPLGTLEKIEPTLSILGAILELSCAVGACWANPGVLKTLLDHDCGLVSMFVVSRWRQ